jgi:DNA-directed RNA polymerase specialized sigma24 family protein
MALEEVAQACDCSLATAKRRIAAAHALVERLAGRSEP